MSALTPPAPVFRRGDVVTYTDRQGNVSEQTVVRVSIQDRYYSEGLALRFYTLAPLGLAVIDGEGMEKIA